jgi:hypothetical protein
VIDVLAVIVVGACLIGFVLVVLSLTHPRHGAVPPVPQRAMRQFVEPLPGDHDIRDGTR